MHDVDHGLHAHPRNQLVNQFSVDMIHEICIPEKAGYLHQATCTLYKYIHLFVYFILCVLMFNSRGKRLFSKFSTQQKSLFCMKKPSFVLMQICQCETMYNIVNQIEIKGKIIGICFISKLLFTRGRMNSFLFF